MPRSTSPSPARRTTTVSPSSCRWSTRRFQYTVKDVALPASGTITTDGVRHDVPAGSWAVLDHGRGRWPYDVAWNWGAGAESASDGRSIGLQVGGRWTDGTGATENAVIVGGVLHNILDTRALELRFRRRSGPGG
ncbi:DUF2804 family protein [Pseudoxanthomonas mexicana]